MRRIIRLFPCLAILFLNFICATLYAQTAAPDPTQAVIAVPERLKSPVYRALVPGLLTRDVFSTTDSDRGISVRVQGLLVGPGKSSDEVVFDADAMLLVRSGRGSILIDGQRNELLLGVVQSIPAGIPFLIENSDESTPISLRCVLLSDTR